MGCETMSFYKEYWSSMGKNNACGQVDFGSTSHAANLKDASLFVLLANQRRQICDDTWEKR